MARPRRDFFGCRGGVCFLGGLPPSTATLRCWGQGFLFGAQGPGFGILRLRVSGLQGLGFKGLGVWGLGHMGSGGPYNGLRHFFPVYLEFKVHCMLSIYPILRPTQNP